MTLSGQNAIERLVVDRFLLLKILADFSDYDVMTKVANWLAER